MKTSKNKIRTAGYFIKRLRDSGFIVIKSFFRYSKSDPRRWTVIVDPSNASVFVTCFTNKNINMTKHEPKKALANRESS